MAHHWSVRMGSLGSKSSSFQHGRVLIRVERPRSVLLSMHGPRVRTVTSRLPSQTDGAKVVPSAGRSACMQHTKNHLLAALTGLCLEAAPLEHA